MEVATAAEELAPGAVEDALGNSAGGQGSLPRGAGRSYGDTAVNGGGRSLSTGRLGRILAWDQERGEIEAEAGVTLGQLCDRVAAAGWIVPCCPGTARVTLGGMVASDVHGKNHAHTGTLGEHVLGLTLVRSDVGSIRCSPTEHPELFRATLGGLGLTGVIESVRLRLLPLAGDRVSVERIRCRSLESVLALLRQHDRYDYGLAWVDSFSIKPAKVNSASARCLVLRATVVPGHGQGSGAGPRALRMTGALARFTPPFLFRRATMRLVNRAYFSAPTGSAATRPLGSFLFPQDEAHDTNHLYGARGAYAHHSWIPAGEDPAVHELLRRAAQPGAQSLVTVLKAFGGKHRDAPGLLSFTGSGTSIALGFVNEGDRTRRQLDALDAIVLDAGGKLYPAKDARMSAASFARSFPRVQEFARHVDPALSSNFWRRVAPEAVP
ncbi:putative decaprenylphosphoryl-beta-D-ribose oxidase [Planctomycetes bacterium Poly30]|uniref:Putative decaprenylphosphoryl-beta-D-ribose oxidase n=1 Tax=Saltatorellus ferox TaxID=2528018 RepID=A0A518EZX5_9BACT|nr:putative decaprenylphosphoryl-beta-D-ribose oxidase [Planctomycetes bacterium Poly30]